MFDSPPNSPKPLTLKTGLARLADAVVIFNDASQIRFFNPAAERLCGYAADEVAGRHVRMLVPRAMRGDQDNWLSAHNRTGAAPREVELERKDGSALWVTMSLSQVTDSENKVLHIAVLRDITRDRTQRLAMEQILAQSLDAVVAVDDLGTVTSFSAGAERLWGYAASEVVGQNARMLMPPQMQGTHTGFRSRDHDPRRPPTDTGQTEIAIRRKDGSVGHARLALREEASGGHTAILSDVSDQQRLTDETLGLIRDLLTQIGQLTNAINTIAQQTNLLSVNASIEAARAGDMGRGFGVVAMEIRALSNQAKDITYQIEGVVEAGRASVAKIGKKSGAEAAAKAGAAPVR